jgi:two-component system chemotaxis response regulator CheB
MVERNRLRVVRGPRENLHRPSIDPLFRSAAQAYGARVIGVILTGTLDDGTSGLLTVSKAGGAAVVQDPDTALFPGMPRSALEYVPDAHVAPLSEIPRLLVRLTREDIQQTQDSTISIDSAVDKENRIAEFEMKEIENHFRVGRPSLYGCPDCGGVLWEIDQNGLIRYRCRVGHAYTTKYLATQQRRKVEDALWAALRALEESAALARSLSSHTQAKQPLEAKDHANRATQQADQARVLREVLLRLGSGEEVEGENEESA